jgi:hypothetical protein
MSKARVERNIYRGPARPELGGASLVFPVRNESFMIEMTLRNYSSELQPRIADFELIVSEDGSTDDTFALANIGLFVGLRLHTFRTDGARFRFWDGQPAPGATVND